MARSSAGGSRGATRVYESMHSSLAWAAPNGSDAAPDAAWSGPSVPTGVAVVAAANSHPAPHDAPYAHDDHDDR